MPNIYVITQGMGDQEYADKTDNENGGSVGMGNPDTAWTRGGGGSGPLFLADIISDQSLFFYISVHE